MLFYVPVLAIAVCSVAIAEPRGGLVRNASLPIAEESAVPVSLVGFFYRGGGGGGYGPSCGCDTAAPSCGVDAGCNSGCGGNYWGGYCGAQRRHHCGLFHHHRGGCCNMDVTCGMAAPSCGIEPSCGAAPSCGCDSAPACGCGRRSHFGHHLMCGGGGGCGGCNYGCRCVGHRHRFWANGWCGQIGDGYCGGNPVDCSGGAMGAPGKMAPMPEVAPPLPMDDVPAKSTRRPVLSPRFSARPIGIGLQ